MIGIALGVAVLITVLSVMNGFDHEIRQRIFNMVPQVTVHHFDNKLSAWPALAQKIEQHPDVLASAPYVTGQAMLTHGNLNSAVMVYGIKTEKQSKVSSLLEAMYEGKQASLETGKYHIVVGQTLAANLGLQMGDKLTMITPQTNVTLFGVMPRLKRFTVTGIFPADGGFNFDQSLVFIDMDDAQKLFGYGDAVSGIRLKIKGLYKAIDVSRDVSNLIGDEYWVSDWTQEYQAYFKTMAMEKTMMFFILFLIVIVAVFNLISSLVMVVTDKRTDIAVLRTLGATPGQVMRVFIVQGAVVGLVGTLLGLAGGLLLSYYASTLVTAIERLFHVHFISAAFYFIDFLPSRIDWRDVIHVCTIAFILSLLATIYPARQAAKIQPADALRYE